MIRFTTTCLIGSMRWVAPFLVLASWTAVVLAGNGTALTKTSSMFPGVLIWSTWITIATGNHDDGPHRDLVAAAVGGPVRLHLARASTAAAFSFIPIVVIAILVRVSAVQPSHSIALVIAATTAFQASAVALGVAIGVWLHRPILAHRGISTLAATAACIAVMICPPIEAVHRSVNDERIRSIGPMLAVCLLVSIVSGLTSGRMAQRRS